VGISRELAEEWRKKTPNESEINRYKRIQELRLFSSFLCKIGYPSYISMLPKLKRTYVPYIFSKEEMNAIFLTCDQLKRYYHNRSTIFMIPALFRLLYGTGLRISEALSLFTFQPPSAASLYLIKNK
jgi:integrase/recombinase XerD